MKAKLILLLLLCFVFSPQSFAQNSAESTEKLTARLQKAEQKKERVTVKVSKDARLGGNLGTLFKEHAITDMSGRVKDINDTGFTLYNIDSSGNERVVFINLADVQTLKRPPSGIKKFFKKVGEYTVLAAAGIVLVPVIGVLSLFGAVPEC
jgi:outer membrane lipoprotein-sorting protein